MRPLLAVLLLAACHNIDDLRDDLDTFCSAEAMKHVGPMNEFGPWYEPKVTSSAMKFELDQIKRGSLTMEEWKSFLSHRLAERNMECPTLDAMFAPRPIEKVKAAR